MTSASPPPDDSANDEPFLRVAEVRALIAATAAAGVPEAETLRCLRALRGTFASLSFGERPDFGDLDPDTLRSLRPGIDALARAMVRSPAADLRTAGYHVMAILGSTFRPDLMVALDSPYEWERIEAGRALARMDGPDLTHR